MLSVGQISLSLRASFPARTKQDRQHLQALSRIALCHLEKVTAAVVQVGHDRGFLAGLDENRYVITTAHCVPPAAVVI